jgi:Cu2+-exporting ATPase
MINIKDKMNGNGEHAHTSNHEMMVRDYKKRFFVSIVLTIPILMLSTMIQKFLGFSLIFIGDKYVLFNKIYF